MQTTNNFIHNQVFSLSSQHKPQKFNLSQKDKIFLFGSLGSLLQTGFALLQALDLMRLEIKTRSYIKLLAAIQVQVEQGKQLSDAFMQFPQLFDELTCAMIATGEMAGELDRVLIILATYLEKHLSYL